VRIGLDSADDNILASAGRRATPARLKKALQLIREYSSLYVSVYLVSGLPGTTNDTLERNITAIEDLFGSGLVNQIRHHLYVPYPTDLCPTGDPRVRLLTDDWSKYDRNSYPVFDLSELTAEQLWAGFQLTEEAIVSSWAHRLAVETDKLDVLPSYPDYHAVTYGLDTTPPEGKQSPPDRLVQLQSPLRYP
jgi:hypothetical protein